MAKTCTLGVALKEYFGLTAHDTLIEMKALDSHDREYFARELAVVGYDIQTKAV